MAFQKENSQDPVFYERDLSCNLFFFFLLQTHIVTYSALNLLTKWYDTNSTYKYNIAILRVSNINEVDEI